MSDKTSEDVPSELVDPLKAAWREYKAACGAVKANLVNDERAGYQGQALTEDGEPANPHELASQLYTDCEREDGDDPKRSNHAFGVIVVSPKTQASFEFLNRTKADLIAVLDDLKGHPKHSLESIKAAAGLTRIHYYKIKRPVKGLGGERPESVRLSIEQKIDVGKRTVDECMELLEDFDTTQIHIQAQLDALRRLKPSEPLAYVFETSNMRIMANVSFPKYPAKTGLRRHAKLRSVMPFYVTSHNPDWAPAIKLPSAVRLEDRVERKERKDRRIDPTPFLPSIHVHRYID
ncbi:hypothetical protein [Marinobacter sp.]|uniref:hypothetical protein n=1 Tax=Marinobacter sp. TaxID=50741 RepID=UPI003567C0DB